MFIQYYKTNNFKDYDELRPILYSKYKISKEDFIVEVFNNEIHYELDDLYNEYINPYILIEEELFFYWKLKYEI